MSEQSKFLQLLLREEYIEEALVYQHQIPNSPPRYAPVEFLGASIVNVLQKNRIEQLYEHQYHAIKALSKGKNILVCTGTASGKTLIYTLGILNRVMVEPDSKFLYVSPLKALAQDQLKQLKAYLYPFNLDAEIYDGDTPDSKRRKIRQKVPTLILTNPDMIHRSILPYHNTWRDLFSHLKLVILDEVHTYRGVFGSHVHQVLKRLKRISGLHGARPGFILLSATIGNPVEFGERLIEEPLEVIRDSGAPKAGQEFLFLNPKEGAGFFGAKVFTHLVKNGIRTIAFTQSRVLTELMYLWAQQLLGPLRGKVMPYRAGFLPGQRRQIERDLATGNLLGVISTSALELGIDIGFLEACILVGYPGTIMNAWQRGGRVGRSNKGSLVILIGKEDALDQYFMKHPQEFFSRPVEKAALDPSNPYVMEEHICCAAAEHPLDQEDLKLWEKGADGALKRLLEKGRLVRSSTIPYVYYSSTRLPHLAVDIRSAGPCFTIFDGRNGDAVGFVDGVRAFKECHPGAIYLHMGRRYLVSELHIDKRDIIAQPTDLNYFTRVRTEKDTEILRIRLSKSSKAYYAGLGDLKVTELVTGYEKRSFPGQVLMGVNPLELPPLIFDTVGLWIHLHPQIKEEVERCKLHFMGGIHAIEHGLIGLLPLFVLCDRNDVGGISLVYHPQLEGSAIFIYDGHPGGIGIAEQVFHHLDQALEKTFEVISQCTCETGCPSCIHSPKCGSGNRPLDKGAAIKVLGFLMGREGLASYKGPSWTKDMMVRINTEPHRPEPKEVLVLDLETKRSAEEVGGWDNAERMGVSVACCYNIKRDEIQIFREEEIDHLLDLLFAADLIVGFNIKRFDYKVLSHYTNRSLESLPTLDLLEYLYNRISRRISLEELARSTLGYQKTGTGIDALLWFKQGDMDKLIEYCKNDVILTKDLYLFGKKNGFVKFFDKRNNTEATVYVRW